MSKVDPIPLEWHNERRRISELAPMPHNPRQMTEKQVKDLTKSLEKFNLVEVPAVNTDDQIIAGHQRLKILRLLGRGGEACVELEPEALFTIISSRAISLTSIADSSGGLQ